MWKDFFLSKISTWNVELVRTKPRFDNTQHSTRLATGVLPGGRGVQIVFRMATSLRYDQRYLSIPSKFSTIYRSEENHCTLHVIALRWLPGQEWPVGRYISFFLNFHLPFFSSAGLLESLSFRAVLSIVHFCRTFQHLYHIRLSTLCRHGKPHLARVLPSCRYHCECL